MAGTRQGVIIYDESGNRVFSNTSGRLLVDAAGSSFTANVSGQAIMITDDNSNLVALVDVADDTLGNAENALNTLGRMYGRSVIGTSWRPAFITQSGNKVSGVPNRLVVALSGDPVSVSGNVIHEHGSALITNPLTQVTNASGGVVLSSGAVFSVTLNNISGNAPVWVGGTGAQAPFSGKGLIVYPGGGLTVKVDSVDDIQVFGEISGQFVSWIGVQK